MTTGLTDRGFDIALREALSREDSAARVLHDAKVELKTDKVARVTDNLAIEVTQPGYPNRNERVPSGILATSADLWMHEYHDGCYLIVPRETMLAVALGSRKVMGGDYNLYENALVPWEALSPRNIRRVG